MCDVLSMPLSTYYHALDHVESIHNQENKRITNIIIQIFFESKQRYGAPKIHHLLKKAKTKQAMYKIDVEYPLAIASLASLKGAQHFLLVSSMNANSKSPIWYSKMKGMLEEQLQEIPFQTISIFRPSLLLGNRSEFRFGELMASKVFRALSLFMKKSWRSHLAIEAKTVAEAMYQVARKENKGVTIYTASQIEELVKRVK